MREQDYNRACWERDIILRKNPHLRYNRPGRFPDQEEIEKLEQRFNKKEEMKEEMKERLETWYKVKDNYFADAEVARIECKRLYGDPDPWDSSTVPLEVKVLTKDGRSGYLLGEKVKDFTTDALEQEKTKALAKLTKREKEILGIAP